MTLLPFLFLTSLLPVVSSFRSSLGRRGNTGRCTFPTSLFATEAPPSLSDGFFTFQTSVFIEDTDAFGMVFYANYLKFYERALADATNSPLAVIHRCDRQKFTRSARLGDDLIVESRLKGRGLREGGQAFSVWEQKLSLVSDDSDSGDSDEETLSGGGKSGKRFLYTG